MGLQTLCRTNGEWPRVQPLRERLGLSDPPAPSLVQVADALILFDDPILDQRFQEAVAMHPDAGVRAALAALPERVAEGSRITRRAAIEWERVAGGTVLEEEFRRGAERFLLEALLESAQLQIQLKTFMATRAPTQDVRSQIDAAIDIHRELAHALRDALQRLDETPKAPPGEPHHAGVGVENAQGDLRGQVERAIYAMARRRHGPRTLVVSTNALRHLRDQGLLKDGATSVLDVPVRVDFAWPGSCFALLSLDSASLDEIQEGAGAPHLP